MSMTETTSPRDFRLTTLEGFTLWSRDSATQDAWVDTGLGEKPAALLAVMLWAGRELSRDEIAQLLWEGFERDRARNSVRQALFRIRRQLGADSVVESGGGLRLTRTLECDVAHLPAKARTAAEVPVDRATLDAFGRTTVIRGRRYAEWCDEVRRWGLPREGRRPKASDAPVRFSGADLAELSPRGTHVAAWLWELWLLTRRGVPMTAFASRTPDADVAQALGVVAARCRIAGGRVARVRAPEVEAYRPYALERDIAAALRDRPGAAGVRPEHLSVLDQVQAGRPTPPRVLEDAIIDLISAVAEDAPLLIVLEDTGRYSHGALRVLISRLTMLGACPVLFVLVGRDGSAPLSTLCIEPPAGAGAQGTGTRSA